MARRGVKKRKLLLAVIAIVLLVCAVPELLYRNVGESTSRGTHGNGSLDDAHLVDYRLFGNGAYFSLLSYFVLDDAYAHHAVVETLDSTYARLSRIRPEVRYRVMEIGLEEGGKTLLHKTHQNGLSVDFMSPKRRGGRAGVVYDYLGLWHYLLEFDSQGRLSFDEGVQIDFEAMAAHLLILDDAAKQSGLRIKKVILKLDLKDDLFATSAGKELKRRGIYFAQRLGDWTNRMHDDHYHVDFELR